MDIIWAIVIILLVMWFLGNGVLFVGGSLIHVLLVVAVIIIFIRLIKGERI
jgi:hypothetical protein